MNFNIIDGDNNYRNRLPEFSRLYNDKNIPVATIKTGMNLSQSEYKKLRRDAIQEGLVTPRTKEYKTKESYKTNPQYVYRQLSKGSYHVIRSINGKRCYYGSFNDYRQAKRMVELLKEYNWDITLRTELKERVLNEMKK